MNTDKKSVNTTHKETQDSDGKKTVPPAGGKPGGGSSDSSRPKGDPPDNIPNPLPGVDPEQTPGIDHLPAERN